jgi:hypothetical protein
VCIEEHLLPCVFQGFGVLTLIVGVWAIAGGVIEFAAGFAAGESAGTRAMFLLGGLVPIASGAL